MENINQPAQQEDKRAAILAYITLIGYIVAIVMHGNNKTKIGSYHLKQATGLILFYLQLQCVNDNCFLTFHWFQLLFLSPLLLSILIFHAWF